MARFGQENERLASEISRMRSGGTGAAGAPSDYKGAAPEVCVCFVICTLILCSNPACTELPVH